MIYLDGSYIVISYLSYRHTTNDLMFKFMINRKDKLEVFHFGTFHLYSQNSYELLKL